MTEQGYNYATLLESIRVLETPMTGPGFQPVRVERANEQLSFDTPFTAQDSAHPLNAYLKAANIEAGWICWPSHIETITPEQPAQLDSVPPPLEAELLLKDGSHINLTRSSGRWLWCQTRLDFDCPPAEATALAQPFTMQSNTPGQVLDYWRIWRWDEQQGMVLKDALFAGFREEKQ